jgi:PEP-CTERM motif
MKNSFGRVSCALCAIAVVLQLLSSTASAVDTMADWVGRNNAPGPTYHFDSQVLDETNTAGNFPTKDNFVVISPTKIGGQKQAKVNFNFDPNNRINEDPLEAVNVNHEHIYLSDQALEGGARNFTNALHMEGTIQFDMPAAGAAGETGAEPNFCFCWYDPTDTRHRVGLGLSNTTTLPLTAAPNALRADLFYASSAGNGFVFATKDGTASEAGGNSLIPDGTYSFVFDYVPATDTGSADTAGSSMSATITDGTTTWSRTLSPLPNAPWFFDGFSLSKFGVIIRSTSGAVRNGVFDFAISNLSYTGGTALAGVPGDYNNNGTVDIGDYVAWRKGGTLANEVDTPGTVNAADYTEWKARFGNVSGSGSGLDAGAVPEPTTAVLALLAGLATVASWRRRS